MKKGTLFFQMFTAAFIMFAVPAGLMYFYDNMRINELNALQGKISWTESEKEIGIIKAQLSEKVNQISAQAGELAVSKTEARYLAIVHDRTIKNQSYSNKAALDKIKAVFLGMMKKHDAEGALVSLSGRVYAATAPELKKGTFEKNAKFILAKSSRKTAGDINFSRGTAEYYMPVTDAKDRLVSVVYIKENIAPLADSIRQAKQSEKGYNFLSDASGLVLLNTDREKEGSENLALMPDLKAIITGAGSDCDIKEADYNNLRGLLGYKKIDPPGFILCVFTPYADYKFMNKKTNTYEPVFFDTTLVVPAYAILAAAFILGLLMIFSISAGPFRPLKKIVGALAHIDEPGFEDLLPKMKKDFYRKIIDSILILRGRVKSSEEKAEKLSAMSRQLEEELSKEASRADMETSELRNILKIEENNIAALENEILKLKEGKAGWQKPSSGTKEPETVSGLLSGSQKNTGTPPVIPGKNVNVPADLLGKKEQDGKTFPDSKTAEKKENNSQPDKWTDKK